MSVGPPKGGTARRFAGRAREDETKRTRIRESPGMRPRGFPAPGAGTRLSIPSTEGAAPLR